MVKRNVNRHNLLCVMLLELRRHFTQCNACRSARKSKDPSGLCHWAQSTILEIAFRWEANIPGRLAAIKGDDPWIFPCPDPNEHGAAYALTAEACIVAGRQNRLL